MGFLSANFQLATHFHSRLRVRHGTDRRIDRRRSSTLNAPTYGGVIVLATLQYCDVLHNRLVCMFIVVRDCEHFIITRVHLRDSWICWRYDGRLPCDALQRLSCCRLNALRSYWTGTSPHQSDLTCSVSAQTALAMSGYLLLAGYSGQICKSIKIQYNIVINGKLKAYLTNDEKSTSCIVRRTDVIVEMGCPLELRNGGWAKKN